MSSYSITFSASQDSTFPRLLISYSEPSSPESPLLEATYSDGVSIMSTSIGTKSKRMSKLSEAKARSLARTTEQRQMHFLRRRRRKQRLDTAWFLIGSAGIVTPYNGMVRRFLITKEMMEQMRYPVFNRKDWAV